MKRLITTVCAAAIAVCSVSAFAMKIGVVDMEKVFKSSPQVKQINSGLRKKFASQRNDIVTKGKQLQADMQNFNKNKSVMNKKKAKLLAAKISKEESSLRMAQAAFQKNLFQAQNAAMSGFMKKVDASVSKVASKQDMDIVMPKNAVIYSKHDMNITSAVMSDLK
ncbi:MAG: OmpH family outer membrane protein [Coxiellaceae bacterium]|nr:OmpH family outer membrane protein [Coxiellaceae bacterium]